MTIPLLPASPSTSSPLTFATDMDAWIASLNPWTEAVNATGSAFAASVSGTSTSSVLVGTGSKSLTVQTGLGFVPGMDLVVAYTTTPTTRMLCTVTSYNNTTGALVVSSYSATGSGTYTAWTVSFTSAVDPVQFVTPTGTQTLTNKTINLSSNTFLATSAQLAAALGDETGSGSVVFSNSPTFTGEPLAPTAAADTNSTQIATTAFVDTAIRGRMRLTASGAITSGQVVVLNSDSTISPVSTSVSSAVLGSEQTQVAAATQWTAVCSIGSTGYTVFADATNVYVGLIDGNTSTMTIGAGVAHGVTGFIQLVYHPVEDKVMMFYSSANQLYCRVGTISGTTFTWSAAGVWSTLYATVGYNIVAKYNTHQNKVVVLHYSSTAYATAAHLSGTTVTYGTPVYIYSASVTSALDLAELPGSAYMLATVYYNNFSYAVGIFINALAVSMTAYTLIGNSSESYAALAYHVPSAKFIACSTGKARAITYPGTSAPTVHPATVITAAGYAYYIGAGALYSGGLIYDPGSTDVIAIAVDSAPNTYLYGTHLSVSGTTVVVGTSTALNTSSSTYPLTIYDTLAGKVLTLFRDAGDSNYGHSLVWEAGNLVTNAGSWIGIAAANISNGATGIVDVPGGISNAVSGLVPGRTYYIDDAGALQQTGTRVIGTAVTATKLLLNGTNASYASLGIFTSAQLAASLSDETGTGLAVFSISPTLTTPTFSGNTTVGTTSTDTLIVRAGSAALPSIAPTGDANTGFWFPSADTVAVSTGGIERVRVDSAGNVGIGGTAPIQFGLYQTKTITGAAFSDAIHINSAAASDVTGGLRGVQSRATTAAASFTLSNLYHFYANPQAFGSGSTVTTQYGFYAESSNTGATNNYGVYSNIASAANRYNFYAGGTADNYFAGSVGVGGTPITGTALRVSKAITGATACAPVFSSGTVQSDVTSRVDVYDSYVGTQAASFTLTILSHFTAEQATIGAGSAVTNQYGFTAISGLTGATNNYGFYSNIAAASNRYNFYAAGTADNYFAGSVGVGGASITGTALGVSKAITGATACCPVFSFGTVQSDVTSRVDVYDSYVGTQAASFTLTTLSHFTAAQAAIGAGSAVTDQRGFTATAGLTGATNNCGFYSNIASAANRYNFYAGGTAPNYLAGVTGIGVAPTATANLTVAASTATVSSLNIPHGAAPTSPVNGDIWTTTAGLFVRINGVTIGPLS